MCGKEVDDDFYTCDVCGAVLKAELEKTSAPAEDNNLCEKTESPEEETARVENAPLPVNAVPQLYDPYIGTAPCFPPTPVKKKRKKWPIVVVCCVLAFLIAVYSIFSFDDGSASSR